MVDNAFPTIVLVGILLFGGCTTPIDSSEDGSSTPPSEFIQEYNILIESDYPEDVRVDVVKSSNNETIHSEVYTPQDYILVEQKFEPGGEYRVTIHTQNGVVWSEKVYSYEYYTLLLSQSGRVTIDTIGKV